MFDRIACHELENGDVVDVGTDRYGNHVLVMDGPGGHETCIQFDRVEVERSKIVFRRVGRHDRDLFAGQLGGQPEHLGTVGEWIRDHANERLGTEAH
jgi:hypothetical protein